MDALPLLVPAHGAARHVGCLAARRRGRLRRAGLVWLGHGRLDREAPSVFVAGIPSWRPMLVFPLGFGLMALRFVVAAFALPPEPGT